MSQAQAGGRTPAVIARVPPKRAASREAVATRLSRYPQEIEREQWPEFLNDFSNEHEGWDSEIRVFLPEDTGRIAAHGLPLEGISIDYKANECTTTLSAGTERADHLQRLVPRTTRIIALTRDELEIDAADRSRTLLRCRRQAR